MNTTVENPAIVGKLTRYIEREHPHIDEIRADPESGFEFLGRYKNGDAVAINVRTVENCENSQQKFDAFSTMEEG